MFCRLALCLLLSCFVVSSTFGQEKETESLAETNKEAPATETATDQDATQESGQDSEFATLLADWTALDTQMKQKAAEFGLVTDIVKQDELRQEYKDMIDDANQLIEELKEAGIAELQANPESKDVTRTLMGIAMNEAQEGRDEDALAIGQLLIENGVNVRYFEVAASSGRITIQSKEIFEELMIRHREAEANDLPQVKITTKAGEVVLELFENESPETVGNFVSLAKEGFYDGLKFHRVISDFMAQGGDPEGNGEGGPGYNIYCECKSPEARRHFTGSISMANKNIPDTGGSQFFLTFRRTSELDGKHTVFGRVVSGMDILRSLTETHDVTDREYVGVEADVMEKVEVIRARDHEYKPNKVAEKEEEETEDSEQPKTQPDSQDGG